MDESKERLSFFRKGWLVKILVIICGVVALLSCIQIESDLQDEGSVTIKFNYKNIIYSDGINQNIGLSSNKDLYGHSYGRSLNEGDPTSMPTSMPTTIQIEEDLLLFGGFRFLAGQTAAVSFICIVLVILLLEHFFHEIHSLTHDTPFAEMVSAMEKELMIVGCTSFAYKVLLTLTNFMDPSTVHTVDVLDTVTVIAALVFCVGGLVLIWMSIRETDIWSQSFHLHVLEILCEYYAVAEDALHDTDEEYWWGLSIEKAIEKSLQSWRWLPVSRINAEIEFRVIHTAFCDTFNLQKDAFAFDDYVSRCFEKHILTLITIDPMNWILLLVLCCVNWLRVYLGFWGPQSWCAAATLRETAGTDDPTVLRDAEIVCKAEVELYCFFGMGCIMVVLNLLLAGVSRYYEFKVMAREGVHCLADYPEFLIAANMAAVAVRVEKTRLSADDLKAAIIASEEHADTIAIEQNPLWNLIASFLSCFYKRTNVMDRQDATRVTKNGQWSSMIMRQLRPDSFSTIDSNEIKGKVSSKGISNKGSTKAGTGNSGSPKRKHRKRRVKKEDGAEDDVDTDIAATHRPKGLISGAAYGTLSSGDSIPGEDRAAFSLKKASTMRDMEEEYNKNRKQVMAKSLKTADGRDMMGVFWSDNADLFFDWVDHMMIIISFYTSVWIVNYVAIAMTVHDSTLWALLTLAPGVASFLIFLTTVRSSTLLKAATRLDQELVHRTMEDAELGEQLGRTVREKILKRLPNDEGIDPKKHLQTLFDHIDTDGSMVLSRLELKSFLKELHISFSNKRWKQIFREIDRNLDDEISFDELFLFIYPDAEEAIKKEQKRIALVKKTIEFYNNVPLISKLADANGVDMVDMNHSSTIKVEMKRRTNIAAPSAADEQGRRRHALDASKMDLTKLHIGEDHRVDHFTSLPQAEPPSAESSSKGSSLHLPPHLNSLKYIQEPEPRAGSDTNSDRLDGEQLSRGHLEGPLYAMRADGTVGPPLESPFVSEKMERSSPSPSGSAGEPHRVFPISIVGSGRSSPITKSGKFVPQMAPLISGVPLGKGRSDNSLVPSEGSEIPPTSNQTSVAGAGASATIQLDADADTAMVARNEDDSTPPVTQALEPAKEVLEPAKEVLEPAKEVLEPASSEAVVKATAPDSAPVVVATVSSPTAVVDCPKQTAKRSSNRERSGSKGRSSSPGKDSNKHRGHSHSPSKRRPKTLGPRVEDLFAQPILTSSPSQHFQQANPVQQYWDHRGGDSSTYGPLLGENQGQYDRGLNSSWYTDEGEGSYYDGGDSAFHLSTTEGFNTDYSATGGGYDSNQSFTSNGPIQQQQYQQQEPPRQLYYGGYQQQQRQPLPQQQRPHSAVTTSTAGAVHYVRPTSSGRGGYSRAAVTDPAAATVADRMFGKKIHPS